MPTNFWANKRVLVTGSAGFVGMHLSGALGSLHALVWGISRTTGDHIDVTDRDALVPYFQKKPEVIFHLAGEALVEHGQEAPFETFQTNVSGTLNILELSRIYHIPRIIIASTAHVYGAGQSPFHEDDPPRQSRPYETSKTMTDLLAQSYADSFNLPVVIPRFANIYGPADANISRLVPKTIRCILGDKPIPLWGGAARREYLYIDDAVEAYLLLGSVSGAKLEKNRIYNFGTGLPITVRDLILTIAKLASREASFCPGKEERTHEITDQFVSWEKARRILGWRPKVTLEEGLYQTIVWYQKHPYTRPV